MARMYLAKYWTHGKAHKRVLPYGSIKAMKRAQAHGKPVKIYDYYPAGYAQTYSKRKHRTYRRFED